MEGQGDGSCRRGSPGKEIPPRPTNYLSRSLSYHSRRAAPDLVMRETDYCPVPLDTSHVCLTEDIRELTELLAKNTHEVWARQRLAEGWRYGPCRDDGRKEHPSLVPYDQLCESEKEYD